MLNEFDVVILKEDMPKFGLIAGAIGTVVHAYTKPDVAYEVEFCNSKGETIAMLPLYESQLDLDSSVHELRKAA